MLRIKKYCLKLVLIVLFPCFLLAQDNENINQVIADLIAAFVENSGGEGDFDFNTLYEQFENLQENPINLNNATRPDLQEIFFLSEIQISQLLQHRANLGDLKTILELQTVPGFDLTTIRMLREVSTVKIKLDISKINFLSTLKTADHTVYLKWKQFIQEQKGFKSIEGADPKYLGDKNHLYLRYKMNVGNDFKLGFIAEKDQGEPYYYPGKTYGADYFSFHIYARNVSDRIRFLSLGDYSISLGQGLIMHSGFGAGKSSLTTSIRKGGYPMRAYTSVAEANFLRGGAITLNLNKHIEWTTFVSSKFRSIGSLVNEDNPFEESFITSLPTGGLNRTESEIERKNLLRQSTIGTAIKYRFKKGHIGAQALFDQFNASFVMGDQLYQLYFPQGDNFINASLDYGYNFRNFNFFGEIAGSKELAISQIHGVLIGLDKTLDLAVNYRNYSSQYRSFSANAFGESPNATNEEGIYLGLEYRPQKMWLINAFVDQWRNPWARFRVDGPGSGREFFLKVKYFKKRKWELYSQFFYEQKLRNIGSFIDTPVENTRQRFRLHGSIKLSKALTLRNRVEFAWYDIKTSSDFTGFLVYQDVLVKPVGANYSFNARYAFFDTDDYDSRIYAYENDILNEYYIPAYNGRGIRFYINTRFRFDRHLTFELRYEATRLSQPFLNDKGEITNDGFGSGNSEILGRTRSQFKTQIKYRF